VVDERVEDELLVDAVARLGGGSPAGPMGAFARRMRKNVCEIDIRVSTSPHDTAERIRQILQDYILQETGSPEYSDSEIVALVGAGHWNLNPTVLTVRIRASEEGSQLLIRGAAKEGLIKQRAGEAAAKRLAPAVQ
jgi:hypothetical protein